MSKKRGGQLKKQISSLFDRPPRGERAVLVHIDFDKNPYAHEDWQEFQELALSAQAQIVATLKGTRQAPDARYFVGSGKAEELRLAVVAHQAQLVIFNHTLTPSQERNLEELLACRVLDRTGLILDIFGERARTFEGKLQVELAQLKHLATRLVRGWTHLERQQGGIGVRGGPGETQLETDRRLIKARIKLITGRLQKVQQQREQGRRARLRAEVPTISFVGYTNAGKSTLFNTLTSAQTYTANRLFATLDPLLRRIILASIGDVIVADTVGFVRNLPHDLVEAFKATLEETRQAKLLLHVLDAHNPQRGFYKDAVAQVLEQIGAADVPQLLIYNKLDLLPGYTPRLDRDEQGRPWRVWVSALTGAGMDLLQQALTELLMEDMVYFEVKLAPSEGKLYTTLYSLGAIIAEQVDKEQGGWLLSVRLQKKDYERLLGRRIIPYRT
jgi:GTP-binding protein HflX